MKVGGDKEYQQRQEYDRKQGRQELKLMIPIWALIRWCKKVKTKVLKEISK